MCIIIYKLYRFYKNWKCGIEIVFFFFAKADFVRDLRSLALLCSSNEYGGVTLGGKRVKFEDKTIYVKPYY